MKLKKVKEFVDFFNKSGLGELEVEYQEGEIKSIKVKSKDSIQSSNLVSKQANFEIKETDFQVIDEVIDGEEVVSPLVGTFYGAMSPEEPNFVNIGDLVTKGQTLCIVEAMKVMNEIQSPRDGKIVKILVENEDVVGFEQPLFIIE